MKRSLVTIFALAMLMATLSKAQTQNVTPSQNNGTSADAAAFAFIAEHEVLQLRDVVTFAQWMETRGKNETGWIFTKPEMSPTQFGPECLTMRKSENLPSGAAIKRELYFYPPQVPSPIIFPDLNAQELINTCTLAIVRIEASAATPEIGRALDQAARQRFASLYGKSVGDANVPLWGRGYYGDYGRWIKTAQIVSGYEAKSGLNDDAPDQLVHGPIALVRAELPIVIPLPSLKPGTEAYRSREAAAFRRAILAAGVDRAISTQMESLYEKGSKLAFYIQFNSGHSNKQLSAPGNDWAKPLIPVLQDWFQALANADPERRAAGLFAADRLLTAFETVSFWPHFGRQSTSTPDETQLRTSLQALGATFTTSFDRDTYFYAGNWLDEARNLAPTSEGGKMAALTWLSNGPACDQARGSEAFRKVISEGEELLAKNVDAHTASEVHFMVGDAYADILAVAGGIASPNGEYYPEKYKPEVNLASTNALKHYRAGLMLDSTSDQAKHAWMKAWRISAGLLPDPHYVCTGFVTEPPDVLIGN